ncbi:MAG TPA: anti-sigma factor [Burkholderiaceae bacterium]
MNYSRPELRDRLAAEYVLGTLQGRARPRFQQLLRGDLELQARVAFWEQQLMPMAAPLSVAAPSARVWQAIAARVAPREQAVPVRPGWLLRGLARCFELRALASVAAGLFVGVAVTLMGPRLLERDAADVAESQLPQSYVGVLATAEGRTGLIVSSLRHGKVMDVKQVQRVPVAPGRTLYLWTLDADGKTRPIGPVPPGGFVQVALSDTSDKLFGSAAELAVSIEPSGATPAHPSGPFVYRGLCGKLWRAPTREK